MTTVERHGPHATPINVFTVEPERAKELAEMLAGATAREHMAPAAALTESFDPVHGRISPRAVSR